jgi:hypothetical protein
MFGTDLPFDLACFFFISLLTSVINFETGNAFRAGDVACDVLGGPTHSSTITTTCMPILVFGEQTSMLPGIYIHFQLGSHHHHCLCKPHILVCLLMFPESDTHDLNVAQSKDAFGVCHIISIVSTMFLFLLYLK